MTAQALYRIFDADGRLLYIGVTCNPGARFGRHRDDKPWWSEVVGITLEHYPDRASVLTAEKVAIKAEQPLYNVVHNRPRTPVAKTWQAEDMPDCCHQGCMRDPDDYDDTIYFPRRWVRGVAEYVCRRGHRWSCGWGHLGSGEADVAPLVLGGSS